MLPSIEWVSCFLRISVVGLDNVEELESVENGHSVYFLRYVGKVNTLESCWFQADAIKAF